VTVCAANVCRSPLLREILSRELAPLGPIVTIASAGIYARDGDAMCEAAAEYAHFTSTAQQSSQVTPSLLAQADLILTADTSQRAWLARLQPSSRARTFTVLQAVGLARQISRIMATGSLPLFAPRMPSDQRARLSWFADELDASRGLTEVGEPLDIDDLHGEPDHSSTFRIVDQSARQFAQALLACAIPQREAVLGAVKAGR